MATKKRSFMQRIPFLKNSKDNEASDEIPERLDYEITRQTLPLAIRDLTTYLVQILYPDEAQIADLIIDQLLDENDPQPIKLTEPLKIDGLGFGIVADFRTLEPYSFIVMVLLEVINLAEARSQTVPEIVRSLPTMPQIYDGLLLRMRDELGLTEKRAQRFMEMTLDYIDPKFEFVQGQIVPMEEDRYCEFKEVNSSQPIPAITKEAYENIRAFLNRSGGRIYFGITDDGIVKGVSLSSKQRDDLQKRLAGKMINTQPPITLDCYRLNFHPILDSKGNKVPDLVIVEVIVSFTMDREETRTQDGRKYIRLDGVNAPVTPAISENGVQANGQRE